MIISYTYAKYLQISWPLALRIGVNRVILSALNVFLLRSEASTSPSSIVSSLGMPPPSGIGHGGRCVLRLNHSRSHYLILLVIYIIFYVVLMCHHLYAKDEHAASRDNSSSTTLMNLHLLLVLMQKTQVPFPRCCVLLSAGPPEHIPRAINTRS